MTKKSQPATSTLEQDYLDLIKSPAPNEAVESLNLEQPHAGQIVHSVTTYSVSEKPEKYLG